MTESRKKDRITTSQKRQKHNLQVKKKDFRGKVIDKSQGEDPGQLHDLLNILNAHVSSLLRNSEVPKNGCFDRENYRNFDLEVTNLRIRNEPVEATVCSGTPRDSLPCKTLHSAQTSNNGLENALDRERKVVRGGYRIESGELENLSITSRSALARQQNSTKTGVSGKDESTKRFPEWTGRVGGLESPVFSSTKRG
jgi:hypothetical protein